MNGFVTLTLWYLDRASALVLFPALWLTVLTGIFFTARGFGLIHRLSRRIHIELAVFGIGMMAVHAIVGTVDAWLVVDGSAPAPNYPLSLFLAGVGVGAVSLVVLVLAALGFLEPRRFDNPGAVHTLAYGGFAFGIVHAVAIGSDMTGLLGQLVVGSVVFVILALALKLLEGTSLVNPTG
ncbi:MULTISPECIES: hypothetical protein [unclassified Haladaptatus]|uniref:hypothetical protein n=1 Tax=unclassified Haladaptatus TaxID=2622732 RepID=UPI00209C6883|nr:MULTISPECIES: hypothetical protein [unclassified Haladaptatus]MCO8246171.1 hypothetical protein [Haladaptatus sp. AB643]MCO8254209.1 hypothetical protein [Haladaptatus sp. AB618]